MAMAKYTFDTQIVSDLHKDAHGFRPTEYLWEEWDQCGDDTRQAMWDHLLEMLKQELEAKEIRTAQSQEAFEARIRHVIAAGACDRATALKWLFQSSDDCGQTAGQDYEHFLWENEVLFSDKADEYMSYLKEAA